MDTPQRRTPRLLSRFPAMQVDLFATRLIARLPVSRHGRSGLRLGGQGSLCLPADGPSTPDSKRLNSFRCVMTLIAPLDWSRSWTSDLALRALEPPIPLPLREDLLIQPGLPFLHQRLQGLNLHTWRLFGGIWQPTVSTHHSIESFTSGENPL